MRQSVARGNIQTDKLHSPGGTGFTLWAHAAPSGECNYYVKIAFLIWKSNFVALHFVHNHLQTLQAAGYETDSS